MMFPPLEKRFLPPANWEQNKFINKNTGHEIHYASLNTLKNNNNLFILSGLSEFTEKYIETAVFFHQNGYAVHVIDWAYQGRSTRLMQNREKRHSDGYETDLDDLKTFIDMNSDSSQANYILGHSMGAHIGLRYLSECNHNIKAASFSAPMINIQSLSFFTAVYSILIQMLKLFSTSYVPGGNNWQETDRNKEDIFSTDPIRKNIHFDWSLHDPELRIGNPTNQWLLESLKSIKLLKNNITIPCLVAIAENEELICNNAIKNFSKNKANIETVFLKGAKHEILMERDEIRDVFLNKTLQIFKKSS